VIPDGDSGRNEKPGDNDRCDGEHTPGRQPRAAVWTAIARLQLASVQSSPDLGPRCIRIGRLVGGESPK